MTAATPLNYYAAARPAPIEVDDLRGYGAGVVNRLQRAIDERVPVTPDPRHPNALFLQAGRDNFYIAPLPSGKVVLLAYWRS